MAIAALSSGRNQSMLTKGGQDISDGQSGLLVIDAPSRWSRYCRLLRTHDLVSVNLQFDCSNETGLPKGTFVRPQSKVLLPSSIPSTSFVRNWCRSHQLANRRLILHRAPPVEAAQQRVSSTTMNDSRRGGA